MEVVHRIVPTTWARQGRETKKEKMKKKYNLARAGRSYILGEIIGYRLWHLSFFGEGDQRVNCVKTWHNISSDYT